MGLTVSDLSGKAIANLNYREINHINPVFIGDTISAKSKIIKKTPSKTKNDRGIIQVETTGSNQHKSDVLYFQRSILLKKRQNND